MFVFCENLCYNGLNNILRKDLINLENKKGFSVLKFLITVICIIFIALSLAVNIMFNQKHSPNVFGYYIYLLNNQDMGNLLPQGTALISKEADGLEIKQGDIILCHL